MLRRPERHCYGGSSATSRERVPEGRDGESVAGRQLLQATEGFKAGCELVSLRTYVRASSLLTQALQLSLCRRKRPAPRISAGRKRSRRANGQQGLPDESPTRHLHLLYCCSWLQKAAVEQMSLKNRPEGGPRQADKDFCCQPADGSIQDKFKMLLQQAQWIVFPARYEARSSQRVTFT